ncbi:unnamed protein product [Thelazia callipaeda]|uniref:U3 small nucleolar ribonucleoprotein protein MPP10 n=1 Tax=Thelazia callipaeda TaxID=103827 RepID=A0A0N5CUZ3_THECL|nr:unnamed protein product [Thelazia callipaeda]
MEYGKNMWPELVDLQLLFNSEKEDYFVNSIEKAYSFVNKIDPAVPTVSEDLITTDDEMIWQQIAFGNKKFHRYYEKNKYIMDAEYNLMKPNKLEQKMQPVISKPDSQHRSSCDVDNDDVNSFNLTQKQIEDIEKSEDSDIYDKENDASSGEDHNTTTLDHVEVQKRSKSVVDDRFFSLAEMHEYLDEQERNAPDPNESLFEEFDTDDDDLLNANDDYRYKEFYENTKNGEKLEKSDEISRSNEAQKKVKKKVRFADETISDIVSSANVKSDDNGTEESADDYNDEREDTILLGQVSDEENDETDFQCRQKKLQERISSIEKINLAPRSWDLSGEVTAIERDENTMLEKYLDFDQSVPSKPIITIDETAKLEAMIMQRIVDKVFDDVVRKERDPKMNAAYRAPVVEKDVVKKSLTEVYEEQYQKVHNRVTEGTEVNEKHEEIRKLISSLFQKLNALSHYRYIPPEVSQEIRVVNNMPSLQKEEVGPMASTDAVLLAPEEVYKHVNGLVKGDDEKTKTDRSRAHRRKKKWQHIRQLKRQEAELVIENNEVPFKKKKIMPQYDKRKGAKKLTSTSFFQNLQTKVTEEVIYSSKFSISKIEITTVRAQKNKTSDLSKKKSGANYKL